MKFSEKLAGLALLGALFLSSCTEPEEVTKNELSVEPSTEIVFNASGNEEHRLKIVTDAPEWNFSVPEWIIAEKDGEDWLTVGAKPNSADIFRSGRVEITAGNADKVIVPVMQNEPATGEAIPVSAEFTDEEGGIRKDIVLGSYEKISVKTMLTFDSELLADGTAEVSFDEEYLAEYNYVNGTDYELFPEDKVSFPAGQSIALTPGMNVSDLLQIDIDASDETIISPQQKYLIPLIVKTSSGISVKKADRVNYVLTVNVRNVKQMVCLEVNTCNPLNVLEYNLEDGTPFFDAVVIFSGNIWWNPELQKAQFGGEGDEKNLNIEFLINNSDTYIQPLRERGIKVYLGVMPHHTNAGLHNLSDWGCNEFAKEVAGIIRDAEFDGVFLDNEWVEDDGNPLSSEWRGNAGEAGMAYYLDKQMEIACSWPTDVVAFQAVGAFPGGWNYEYIDFETQEKHPASEYLDVIIGDYGNNGSPVGDLSNKNCNYRSMDLTSSVTNPGLWVGGASGTDWYADNLRDGGYGWVFSYAFNPDPTYSGNNYGRSIDNFNGIAREFYGQGLQTPKGYYTKKDASTDSKQPNYEPDFIPYEF